MNFRGRGLIDGMDFRQLQEAASAAMLARQSSIYSLTFDELHSAMGGYVKDFGSMNMDEFLKSVWTAEESQAMETSLRTPDQVGLQRQGSFTLPRTLSHKTVDEVWRGLRDCGTGGSEFQQQQTALGEITLEEFLVRAGVVREEMSRSVNTGIPSGVTANGVLYGDSMEGSGNNNTCPAPLGFLHVGRSTVGGMESSTERRLYAAPQLALGSNGDLGCSQGMRGGGVNNGVISPMNRISADGRNGDQSSLSPFPYVFNGGFSGKRANGAVEKTVERRQRRMIKNRESAARSRARKQAYTMELEAEVAQLKEENEELQKKQAEIMEMQRNQVIEMRNQQRRTKLCLRRTQTSPW